MKIINSSIYNDEEVEWLVKFGMAGINTETLVVKVRNHASAGSGYAYKKGLVTINIGKPEDYPSDNLHTYIRTKNKLYTTFQHPYGSPNSPYIQYNDWKEKIVGLAAHEGRHIYQYQNNLFIDNSELAEEDCEKYALKRLATYRNREK